MAKINISIELNEQEVDELLNDEEDDKELHDSKFEDTYTYKEPKEYTLSEMLAANQDELNWIKGFYAKHNELFEKYERDNILARYDLVQRIKLGEKIVKELEGQ